MAYRDEVIIPGPQSPPQDCRLVNGETVCNSTTDTGGSTTNEGMGPGGADEGGTSMGVNPGGNPAWSVPWHEHTIAGFPTDAVIVTSVLLSMLALVLSLRASFGRMNDTGLPLPNWAAILSAAAAVFTVLLSAAVYVVMLSMRVEALERAVGLQ